MQLIWLAPAPYFRRVGLPGRFRRLGVSGGAQALWVSLALSGLVSSPQEVSSLTGPGTSHTATDLGLPMVGVVFDSDDPNVLKQAALAGCRVATYSDLATPALVSALGARCIWIDRGHGDPLGIASVVDIEPGLYTVANGVAKVQQMIAEKRPTPAVYHDRSDWPAITAALHGTSVRHWVSTLDGTCLPQASMPAAVQILGEKQVGFHADLSIVWDDSWHPVAAPLAAAEVTKLRQLAVPAMAGVRPLIAYIESLLHAVRTAEAHMP